VRRRFPWWLLALALATGPAARAQTAISLAGGNVVLSFPTASNRLYNVQRADVPASDAWSTIASNIVGTGGVGTNIDAGAAMAASHFYRVGSFNPSTNGGTVVVLVQFTGEAPVQGALVILSYSGTGQYGYTDNSNQIVFANVPVGSFTVQAYSPDDGSLVGNGSGNVPGAGSIATTTVTMPGTGSVEVWVDFASGDPAVTAEVYIISGTSTNGPGYTDSTGELTALGIPVGGFTVIADNPTNATSSATGSGTLATNGASATLYLNLP
jgi:hypothetical protein